MKSKPGTAETSGSGGQKKVLNLGVDGNNKPVHGSTH